MAKIFNKQITRSITDSLGRFLAIVGIVALGCGFYAGLRMTGPDMRIAADEYYDQTQLMDVRVVSTLGLSADDMQEIANVEGVTQVMGALETDVMATINGEQYAIRMHSLPYDVAENAGNADKLAANNDGEGSAESAVSGAADEEDDSADEGVDGDGEGASLTSDFEDPAAGASTSFPVVTSNSEAEAMEASAVTLNQLTLVEGRWPIAPGECVISADNVMNSPTNLGDTITITEGSQDLDSTLRVRTYTIVGFVQSPYYVSTAAMGSTTLGSGKLNQYMYVPANDFSESLPYTEAFLRIDAATQEFAGSDDYQAVVDEVVARINAIAPVRETARAEALKAATQAKLDEARDEYEAQKASAERQLADAQATLDDAQKQITDGEKNIEEGQASYDSGVAELAQSKQTAQTKFDQAQAEIDANAKQLSESAAQLEASKAQLDAAWVQAGVSADEAAAVVAQLEAALAQLPAESDQYAQVSAQLTSLRQLQQAQAQYDSGAAQLAQGQAQLEAARTQLASQKAQTQAQLATAQAQLDSAKAALEQGKADLEQAKQDYENGLTEYENAKAEADEKLASAQQKLDDAQDEIDALETPEWLVMDRTKNPGVVSFASDAERIDSIAAVFPFIFFLVAALVALTTMTRMVEEERMLIGTFKALGYTKARITSKYMIYAAVASVAGAVVGIIALTLILPPVIMEAYAIIYSIPHSLVMPIDAPIALLAAALGVGVTLFATWAAATATLREAPAALMQPPAPKAGKRILLEHVKPVWAHMSFSWKVTARNIFRYKKRLIMTVVGIAGCTGLLLTGLGLQDSINDIIDKQYGELVNYNVEVTGEHEFTDSQRTQLEELAQEGTFALNETKMVESSDGADISVGFVVPQDADEFQSLWIMRNRTTGQNIELEDDSVILTEKLAKRMGVTVGDVITVSGQDKMGNPDTEKAQLTVTAIMENYISNYIFAGQGAYKAAFGEDPKYSSYYAEIGEDDSAHEQFRESAQLVENVKTIAFNDEVIDAYRTMLKSVNMIVIVLVVCAAALAFIVLYNLTNINITERQREIATLKVLGFTRGEVDAYIFREIMILTILGALCGLAFGVLLEGFVVVTAEVDYVMFGRTIHAPSFVVAFLLTLVFAVVVMIFMRRKLDKVDMIESLKSLE